MATKLRMLKLLQELRGFAEIVNRRPPPRSAALWLAQVRPHVVQAVLPRRSLRVTMVELSSTDIPHPVKINHLKQTPAPTAMLRPPELGASRARSYSRPPRPPPLVTGPK